MMAEAVANQTTPEAAITAPVTELQKPVEEKISPKLQVLVQREKQALEIERRSKQSLADLTAREQQLAEREAKIKEFESLKEKDPMKALSLLGLSYQQMTDIALNDGSVPPEIQVKKVEEKLESYLKAQEAAKQELAESEKRQAAQREEKAIADFKSEIHTYIHSDPKQYELTKFEGLEEYVFLTIDEHFTRTINPETGVGQILSIKEAADKVESMLEKKYADAKKLTKFQAQTPPLVENVVKQQQFTTRPKQQRTLTNQLSATPSAVRPRPMTEQQRIDAVIANFAANRR